MTEEPGSVETGHTPRTFSMSYDYDKISGMGVSLENVGLGRLASRKVSRWWSMVCEFGRRMWNGTTPSGT
jgi:hypothetical protein